MSNKQFLPAAEQRQTIKALASYGMPHEQIALVIFNPNTGKPISPITLRKHFKTELATGSILATANVAQNLYRIATGNEKSSVTAAIFWLKTRAQWKETSGLEVTGKNGQPLIDDNDAREAAQILLGGRIPSALPK